MSNTLIENEGDNKEFYVADISDVTVYIGKSGKTSADDTATERYFNNAMTPIASASKLSIRNDQTIQIVSMNGVTFTDPITIIINKGHTEIFDSPIIYKIVLRTTVVNTLIRMRIK